MQEPIGLLSIPLGITRVGATPRPGRTGMPETRFLRFARVAVILDTSDSQTYALMGSGDLTAIKVGGRGQWRVEATELESYIQRIYVETCQFVAMHPLGPADDDASHPDE